MNRIEAVLIPDERELARKELHLVFDIMIDGISPLQSNDDGFSVSEFLKSTQKNGIYFIWTCSCGEPGCAGYFEGIEVRIEEGITYWKDNDQDKSYLFDTKKLLSKALILEGDIQKWKNYAEKHQAKLRIWH